MKRQTTLLIGNGLNLADGAASWGDLIEFLRPPRLTLGGRSDGELIPLPIQFEIIGANGGIRSSSAGSDPYSELKKWVCDELKRMELHVGEAHKRIIGIHPDNVITTNYDRCLNRFSLKNPRPIERRGGKRRNTPLKFQASEIM